MDHSEQKRKFVFHTQRRLNYGECVFVTGNHYLLGNWNPIKAIKLKWSQNDNWILGINIGITSTITIEYKYFISDELLSKPPKWDDGANKVVELTYYGPNESSDLHANQLSVMSFNVYYNLSNWNSRKHMVFNIINWYRPDFVGLQELTAL